MKKNESRVPFNLGDSPSLRGKKTLIVTSGGGMELCSSQSYAYITSLYHHAGIL